MRKSVERMELVHDFLKRAFSGSLHAKRILSLANGTLGVLTGASLAVSVIGHALAQARGLADRHAIKQVDRLLSNGGVVVWDLFAPWAREVVGQRKAIVVAMDWTDFDADHQATLALSLITRHGRATPLLWLTVDKDELKDQRNDFEDLCLTRLKAILPEGVAVTILADRGFGDVKLFEFLESLGFGYVIRFRGNVHVTAADGQTRLAADWVGKAGRARLLRGAELTAARHKVGAAVCVHAKGMKEAWHLAASDATASASQIVNLYAKRWTIEPGFRDTKDLRFGMGLSVLRIGDPQRRDRLLLLNALAILLLTLLGAAGESLGMDRSLRTSTVKRRVHSLFRQGCLLYDLIPNMPEQRLRPLVEKYEEFLNQNNVSFASLSPTPASSVSTTKRSQSNTRNARPAACEPAASAARKSCAASSSTCCRAASTRSAISACGIPRSATTPLGCGRAATLEVRDLASPALVRLAERFKEIDSLVTRLQEKLSTLGAAFARATEPAESMAAGVSAAFGRIDAAIASSTANTSRKLGRPGLRRRRVERAGGDGQRHKPLTMCKSKSAHHDRKLRDRPCHEPSEVERSGGRNPISNGYSPCACRPLSS